MLDLNEKDLADLKIWKLKRLFALKKEKNSYTEGTFWILHKVYTDAAGKTNKRDVQAGLVAIKSFIESLNQQRTMQIFRENDADGYYSYYCGLFSNREEAERHLKELQKKGLNGFVVAFKNEGHVVSR